MTALRLLTAARAGDEAEIEALIARGVKGTRKQLIKAARAGEADVVDVLVRSGTRGTRPQLEAAREAGELAVEEALLRTGAAGPGGRLLMAYRRDDSAEIEALKREGALAPAALQRTLERTLSDDEPEVAAALLHAGANPNATHSKSTTAPVFQSAHSTAMLGVLIAEGADLNAPPPIKPTTMWLSQRLISQWIDEDPPPWLAMLKLALMAGADPNARDHNGATALDLVAIEAALAAEADGRLTPDHRRRLIAAIEALIEAGAERDGALTRYRDRVTEWGGADTAIAAALGGDAARMNADFEHHKLAIAADRAANPAKYAAIDAVAERLAGDLVESAVVESHPARRAPSPAPAAPVKHATDGFRVALLFTGAMALAAFALMTCAGRPAPAAEADPPGWRFTEAVDGDTLAFAVPAFPAPLARVLVRLRGVDTPERRRPKCEWERHTGEAATAYTAAALEAARTIAPADLAWEKYGGRVLARAPVDGRDPVEASIADGHGRPYDDGRRARGAAA